MRSKKRVSQASPLIRWILLSTVLIVPFLILTGEYFSTGLATDTSGIIYVIIGLFTYGIAHSFRNAYGLLEKEMHSREWRRQEIHRAMKAT